MKDFKVSETETAIIVTLFGETREFPRSALITHPDSNGGYTHLLSVETAVYFRTGNKIHRGQTAVWFTTREGVWKLGATSAKNRNGLKPVGWWDTVSAQESNAARLSQSATDQIFVGINNDGGSKA